jgi:hypothetical protein
MAIEQPLWRGKTHAIGHDSDKSWFLSMNDLQVPLPPDTPTVVLSASHYDALVDRVEELTDAIRDHAEVCSRFGEPQRLRKLIGEDDG